MTNSRARLVACLALLATAAGVASAEPLDLGRVPAKAVWMMHLDMDAAWKSSVVKRMYDRAAKMHPQLEAMMGMAVGMTGMDPRKDFHDVTVYGLDTDKRNAVMIVHAGVRRELLEKMAEKARDHKTMKHRDYTLHSWTHKGWKGHDGETVVGAFYQDDVMVFARSADLVEMALDVLDDRVESVGEEGPLAGRVLPGSILVGRASAVDPDTKCPVLRRGKGFRVAMGESDGKSFYRALLSMESAEAAGQAEDVVAGLMALATLRYGSEADVMKLVTGVETATEGETCRIAWDAAADDVWKVAARAAEKMEARQREWSRKRGGCGDCGKDGCDACGRGKCPMDKDKEQGERKEGRRPFGENEF